MYDCRRVHITINTNADADTDTGSPVMGEIVADAADDADMEIDIIDGDIVPAAAPQIYCENDTLFGDGGDDAPNLYVDDHFDDEPQQQAA